ncbi:unnamed protein product, partial [Staurois parvus]
MTRDCGHSTGDDQRSADIRVPTAQSATLLKHAQWAPGCHRSHRGKTAAP